MYILLKLADAARRECMRNGLPFACMLCSISRIEQTSLNGDECVIVFAFEKAIAVTVDDWDCRRVSDRNVVRLDPDSFAKACMGLIDGKVAASAPALEPRVSAELRGDAQ